MTVAGLDAFELFATFIFAKGEEDKYAIVVGKFEEHCKEEKNEIVERYNFRCRVQREGESFDQFVTD